MKLVNELGLLSEEGKIVFKKIGKNTSCECPHHLVDLLESAEKFTAYQKKCLIEKPQDEHIHNWLKATSINIEHLISSTILTLARLEGLIDENNEFTGNDEIES
jgi:hypothetical protein